MIKKLLKLHQIQGGHDAPHNKYRHHCFIQSVGASINLIVHQVRVRATLQCITCVCGRHISLSMTACTRGRVVDFGCFRQPWTRQGTIVGWMPRRFLNTAYSQHTTNIFRDIVLKNCSKISPKVLQTAPNSPQIS